MLKTFCVGVLLAVAAVLSGAAASRAAQPVTLESFAGAWEGSAQTPDGDVSLRASFKVVDGKLVAAIESSIGVIPVTAAAIAGDKLMLTIEIQGSQGTLACALKGSRIDGLWELGDNKGSFWLVRGGAGAPAAGGDNVAGSWAGEAQVAGQVMPFTLVLREGQGGLAGEIGSAEGSVPLTSATWKGGTLELAFTYVGGQPVSMTAKLEGGKLAGAIDVNKGEAAGTWTAVRKQ